MTDLNLDQLLEEARIQRVLVRYAQALDERDWAALDEVFTDDARVRYESIGEFSGRAAIVEVVRTALAPCGRTQHLIGNFRIALDGPRATASCYLQAIHRGLGERAGDTLTVWGEYRDRLERRAEGWRIAERELVLFQTAGTIGPTALDAG
jgi:3-phenylpropionate/cinnamic acid dioxygenase small subunit